jgi:hypothetical protein
VTPELLREFLAHLSKPDDETVVFADGRAVEIPV